MITLPRSTSKFILYFVRLQWQPFILFICVSVFWAVNDTIFPYFLKRIVNTLAAYQHDPVGIYQALKSLLILIVFFWITMEFLQRLQGFVQAFTFPKLRANIRANVFQYVQSHSHEYFSSHFAGNIAKKLSDLPNSVQMVLEIFCFQFVTAITGASVACFLMLTINPVFSFIVIVWLTIHLGLSILFVRYGNHLWAVHSDAEAVLSGKIVDALTNILNVRLFARSKYESLYLKKFQTDEIQKAKRAMIAMELTRIGLGLNGLFLVFSMIFTLLYGWVHQWVSLGDFTQVGMQTFWLLGWMWFVGYQMMVFAREAGIVSNALALIRHEHDLVDKPNASTLKMTAGEICFDHVSFAYGNHRTVFENLNVTIMAGQKVGLVGFSGSGKSTFVNLILRFYDLPRGKILIDQQDIASVTQESLRAQIAMIPQDPALFHRSLMENIRYGRLNATDEEVRMAASKAHCDEFIEKLDDQYDSLVGERGIKLSGGQRQRIAIARAILKNAPILILDEATSSLDSITEKLIQDSLNELMSDRTTIVVAHRLSTLATMDRILVFHKGYIVEDGTKEQLLKAHGHFARLWNMQVDGFLPEESF